MLFALVGCAGPVYVGTQWLSPALTGLELPPNSRIAVVDFEEDYSSVNLPGDFHPALALALTGNSVTSGHTAISARIRSALVNLRVARQPFFKVVERDLIAQMLQERELITAGVLTPRDVATAGQLLGAEYILTGSSNLQLQTLWDVERYTRCLRYDENEDVCLEIQSRSVRCEVRFVRLDLIPRLIDVGSSEVLYSKEISETLRESACDGREYAPWGLLPPYHVRFELDPFRPVARILGNAIETLIRDIAPHYTRSRVYLQQKPVLKDRDIKRKFALAMEVLQQDSATGCGMLRELLLGPGRDDSAVIFNVAVCDELSGQLQRAQQSIGDLMQRYLDAGRTPPDFLWDSADRIKEKIRSRESLQRQTQPGGALIPPPTTLVENIS